MFRHCYVTLALPTKSSCNVTKQSLSIPLWSVEINFFFIDSKRKVGWPRKIFKRSLLELKRYHNFYLRHWAFANWKIVSDNDKQNHKKDKKTRYICKTLTYLCGSVFSPHLYISNLVKVSISPIALGRPADNSFSVSCNTFRCFSGDNLQ